MIHQIVSQPGRALLAVTLLSATAVLAATGGQAIGQGGKAKTSADEIKVTPEATKPDASGKQVIVLHIDVNKGWYIYANPVGNQDFEPNHTEVKVTGKVKPASVKVEYPPGLVQKLGDERYRIYEGKVAIRALVQRAPGDTGPLDVTVRVNTCSKEKGLCLPPGQVQLKVP